MSDDDEYSDNFEEDNGGTPASIASIPAVTPTTSARHTPTSPPTPTPHDGATPHAEGNTAPPLPTPSPSTEDSTTQHTDSGVPTTTTTTTPLDSGGSATHTSLGPIEGTPGVGVDVGNVSSVPPNGEQQGASGGPPALESATERLAERAIGVHTPHLSSGSSSGGLTSMSTLTSPAQDVAKLPVTPKSALKKRSYVAPPPPPPEEEKNEPRIPDTPTPISPPAAPPASPLPAETPGVPTPPPPPAAPPSEMAIESPGKVKEGTTLCPPSSECAPSESDMVLLTPAGEVCVPPTTPTPAPPPALPSSVMSPLNEYSSPRTQCQPTMVPPESAVNDAVQQMRADSDAEESVNLAEEVSEGNEKGKEKADRSIPQLSSLSVNVRQVRDFPECFKQAFFSMTFKGKTRITSVVPTLSLHKMKNDPAKGVKDVLFSGVDAEKGKVVIKAYCLDVDGVGAVLRQGGGKEGRHTHMADNNEIRPHAPPPVGLVAAQKLAASKYKAEQGLADAINGHQGDPGFQSFLLSCATCVGSCKIDVGPGKETGSQWLALTRVKSEARLLASWVFQMVEPATTSLLLHFRTARNIALPPSPSQEKPKNTENEKKKNSEKDRGPKKEKKVPKPALKLCYGGAVGVQSISCDTEHTQAQDGGAGDVMAWGTLKADIGDGSDAVYISLWEEAAWRAPLLLDVPASGPIDPKHRDAFCYGELVLTRATLNARLAENTHKANPWSWLKLAAPGGVASIAALSTESIAYFTQVRHAAKRAYSVWNKADPQKAPRPGQKMELIQQAHAASTIAANHRRVGESLFSDVISKILDYCATPAAKELPLPEWIRNLPAGKALQGDCSIVFQQGDGDIVLKGTNRAAKAALKELNGLNVSSRASAKTLFLSTAADLLEGVRPVITTQLLAVVAERLREGIAGKFGSPLAAPMCWLFCCVQYALEPLKGAATSLGTEGKKLIDNEKEAPPKDVSGRWETVAALFDILLSGGGVLGSVHLDDVPDEDTPIVAGTTLSISVSVHDSHGVVVPRHKYDIKCWALSSLEPHLELQECGSHFSGVIKENGRYRIAVEVEGRGVLGWFAASTTQRKGGSTVGTEGAFLHHVSHPFDVHQASPDAQHITRTHFEVFEPISAPPSEDVQLSDAFGNAIPVAVMCVVKDPVLLPFSGYTQRQLLAEVSKASANTSAPQGETMSGHFDSRVQYFSTVRDVFSQCPALEEGEVQDITSPKKEKDVAPKSTHFAAYPGRYKLKIALKKLGKIDWDITVHLPPSCLHIVSISPTQSNFYAVTVAVMDKMGVICRDSLGSYFIQIHANDCNVPILSHGQIHNGTAEVLLWCPPSCLDSPLHATLCGSPLPKECLKAPFPSEEEPNLRKAGALQVSLKGLHQNGKIADFYLNADGAVGEVVLSLKGRRVRGGVSSPKGKVVMERIAPLHCLEGVGEPCVVRPRFCHEGSDAPRRAIHGVVLPFAGEFELSVSLVGGGGGGAPAVVTFASFDADEKLVRPLSTKFSVSAFNITPTTSAMLLKVLPNSEKKLTDSKKKKKKKKTKISGESGATITHAVKKDAKKYTVVGPIHIGICDLEARWLGQGHNTAEGTENPHDDLTASTLSATDTCTPDDIHTPSSESLPTSTSTPDGAVTIHIEVDTTNISASRQRLSGVPTISSASHLICDPTAHMASFRDITLENVTFFPITLRFRTGSGSTLPCYCVVLEEDVGTPPPPPIFAIRQVEQGASPGEKVVTVEMRLSSNEGFAGYLGETTTQEKSTVIPRPQKGRSAVSVEGKIVVDRGATDIPVGAVIQKIGTTSATDSASHSLAMQETDCTLSHSYTFFSRNIPISLELRSCETHETLKEKVAMLLNEGTFSGRTYCIGNRVGSDGVRTTLFKTKMVMRVAGAVYFVIHTPSGAVCSEPFDFARHAARIQMALPQTCLTSQEGANAAPLPVGEDLTLSLSVHDAAGGAVSLPYGVNLPVIIRLHHGEPGAQEAEEFEAETGLTQYDLMLLEQKRANESKRRILAGRSVFFTPIRTSICGGQNAKTDVAFKVPNSISNRILFENSQIIHLRDSEEGDDEKAEAAAHVFCISVEVDTARLKELRGSGLASFTTLCDSGPAVTRFLPVSQTPTSLQIEAEPGIEFSLEDRSLVCYKIAVVDRNGKHSFCDKNLELSIKVAGQRYEVLPHSSRGSRQYVVTPIVQRSATTLVLNELPLLASETAFALVYFRGSDLIQGDSIEVTADRGAGVIIKGSVMHESDVYSEKSIAGLAEVNRALRFVCTNLIKTVSLGRIKDLATRAYEKYAELHSVGTTSDSEGPVARVLVDRAIEQMSRGVFGHCALSHGLEYGPIRCFPEHTLARYELHCGGSIHNRAKKVASFSDILHSEPSTTTAATTQKQRLGALLMTWKECDEGKMRTPTPSKAFESSADTPISPQSQPSSPLSPKGAKVGRGQIRCVDCVQMHGCERLFKRRIPVPAVLVTIHSLEGLLPKASDAETRRVYVKLTLGSDWAVTSTSVQSSLSPSFCESFCFAERPAHTTVKIQVFAKRKIAVQQDQFLGEAFVGLVRDTATKQYDFLHRKTTPTPTATATPADEGQQHQQRHAAPKLDDGQICYGTYLLGPRGAGRQAATDLAVLRVNNRTDYGEIRLSYACHAPSRTGLLPAWNPNVSNTVLGQAKRQLPSYAKLCDDRVVYDRLISKLHVLEEQDTSVPVGELNESMKAILHSLCHQKKLDVVISRDLTAHAQSLAHYKIWRREEFFLMRGVKEVGPVHCCQTCRTIFINETFHKCKSRKEDMAISNRIWCIEELMGDTPILPYSGEGEGGSAVGADALQFTCFESP